MMKSRKLFLGTLGTFGALSTIVPRSTVAATAYTMRYGLGEAPGTFFPLVADHFAAEVKRRSNGQLIIETYPGGTLGSQQESISMLSTGALDFTKQASSLLVSLVPSYQLFDLPFLFKDLNAGYRVVDGPIGRAMMSGLESHGILGLAWEISGMKAMETTSKAIQTPEDMKGLRIRIQGGPVFVAMYQALGALPVVIDVTEVYSALAQRTIDGLDVSLDSFVAGKWFSVVKHAAISNHVIAVNPMMGSKKNIEALPAPLQKIIKEEARAMDLYSRSLLTTRLADATQVLKSNGVSFTEIQRAAFRKVMDPVYAGVAAKLGSELIERVSRTANAG